MATHPVKLIAWTPRLGNALTDLTKGIGTTTLKQQEIQPPKQEIIPTDKVGGGELILGAVVAMPTSGGGIGIVSPVTIGSGGEISITSGAQIHAKFPYLDGYN